eukprot:4547863-Pyramimonas_sp.AAC.1
MRAIGSHPGPARVTEAYNRTGRAEIDCHRRANVCEHFPDDERTEAELHARVEPVYMLHTGAFTARMPSRSCTTIQPHRHPAGCTARGGMGG